MGEVRTQGQLPVFGSALQGPGIPIEDLADFSELLTKPETIAESPGAQDWDFNSITLSSVRPDNIDNPSRHLYGEDYSSTSTSLPRSSPVTPTRTSGAKKVKVQQESSQDIFADSKASKFRSEIGRDEASKVCATSGSLVSSSVEPELRPENSEFLWREIPSCTEEPLENKEVSELLRSKGDSALGGESSLNFFVGKRDSDFLFPEY